MKNKNFVKENSLINIKNNKIQDISNQRELNIFNFIQSELINKGRPLNTRTSSRDKLKNVDSNKSVSKFKDPGRRKTSENIYKNENYKYIESLEFIKEESEHNEQSRKATNKQIGDSPVIFERNSKKIAYTSLLKGPLSLNLHLDLIKNQSDLSKKKEENNPFNKFVDLFKDLKNFFKKKKPENSIKPEYMTIESQENLVSSQRDEKNNQSPSRSPIKVKFLLNQEKQDDQWDKLANEDLPIIPEFNIKNFIKGKRKLKCKNKVYDSLSEEENDEEIVKNTDIRKLSIHPESEFISYSFICFYSLTYFPLVITFSDVIINNKFMNRFGAIIDLILIFDFFNFLEINCLKLCNKFSS